MKTLLTTGTLFAALCACSSLAMAQAPGAPDKAAPDVSWAPSATPSIVEPSRNLDFDGWHAFADRKATPSVDQKLTDPILIGAIDLHAHAGPDSYDRQWDAFEVAKLAKARGMRAVVIKDHWSQTAGIVNLVRKYGDVGDLQVFGGLALNSTVGGINPQAVRYFAEVNGRYGRIVWMPTHDSEHEVKFLKQARPYVRVSQNGVLLPQVLEVLDLIKHYQLTLGTGHVDPGEMLQIVAEARKRGIDRIIITHPRLGPMFTHPTMAQLKQAVAMGGTVEIVAMDLLRGNREQVVREIREIGPAHVFVGSDSGLTGTPNHPDALVLSIRALRAAGFSEGELDLMFRKNPARLIGLTD